MLKTLVFLAFVAGAGEEATAPTPPAEAATPAPVEQESAAEDPGEEERRDQADAPASEEPESAEPESAEPESGEPESAEPESAEPESAEPESAPKKKVSPAPVGEPTADPNAADERRSVVQTAPDTPVWDDAEERLPMLAQGGVDVCEAVSFPLTLLPAVGSVAATLVDWVCLIPASMAVDYYGLWHADTGSFLWQPLLGLLLAKAWRGVILVAGITTIVIASLAYSTAAVGGLIVAGLPYYIPVGLTGLITVIGGLIIGMRWLQKKGSPIVFEAVYFGLSEPLTPEQAQAKQAQAMYKPPPDPFFRAFALMSAAAGANPKGNLLHAIPVAGPLFRAPDQAAAIDEEMIRMGKDVLGEEPQHEEVMRAMSATWSWTEGALGAAGQALLLVGGATFVAGTVAAAVTYGDTQNLALYAGLIGGLGAVGVVAAGAGVGLILLREVPRVLRNLTVPLAYGLLPPDRSEYDVE